MDETLPPKNPVQISTRSLRSLSSGRGAAAGAGAAEAPAAIGPYRVAERLGVGGMGVVYRCRDETLDRFVAIKVLQEKYAADDHYRQRFLREARTIASLSHPSIAHVYGIGEEGAGDTQRLIYIVMELVEGPSVEALLQREGAIPLDRAVRLVRDTALGLQAALAKGIVHRDVKPSNLLVSGTGSVKIVDFGLAKELGGKNSMTAEGIVLGTPHYISPEQGRGRAVDHRSDIYSLGATFYNLVTGKPPFEGTSQVSVIVAHVNEAPAPPHELRAGIPETASRVILRMMAKSPDGRYPTYAELVEDLDLLLEGKEPRHAGAGVTTAFLPRPAPARKRRAGPVLGAAAAVILLSGAAFLLLGGPPDPSPAATAALGRWHVKLDDGRDVLDMDFAEPPGGRSGAETWRRLVLPPAELPADAAPPHISGKSLRWDGFTSPFACGLPFERIDEILVSIGTTTGSFDLGIAIVDPSGASVRSLLLALRPAEVTERPLAASLRGEDAGGATLPPVPRLGQGPFDITVAFRPGPSSTSVRVTIARRPSGRTVYDAACNVQGTDWASGVLVLLTPSPVKPFSVSIDRARITGLLTGGALEDVPWRA